MSQVQLIAMNNFDKLWEIYPRKVGKKAARTSFNRLPKRTQEECIEGVKNYIKQINIYGTEKPFIKHASTFINGEHWEDEFETEIELKLSANDFRMDTSGSSRIGYCSSCKTSDFYDKFSVHQMLSRCCGKDLHPSR